MFVYLAFIIISQFLYGCWVGIQPVQSQTRVITKHNLPQNRLGLVYGSQNNGSCTNASLKGRSSPVCIGTSVLNDGMIPEVNTSNSTWASELFTLNGTRGDIRLSFEVDSESHDRMKLAVFNCPEMRINLPSFSVYFDDSFRPDRNTTMDDLQLGTLIMKSQLVNTSCDRLLVFCVKYNTTQPSTRFINLVIPNENSDYIFLGEVTFLNGSSESCDLAMPIIGPIATTTTNDDDTLSNATELNAVPIVVVLVLVSIIVVIVVLVLLVVVCLKTHKHRYDSSKVHHFQSMNVVLDPETREDEKEEESYMDSQYDVIDKPLQNGVKTGTNSATIMDALYSNPDETITNDNYSHLRESQKKNVTPEKIAAAGYEYSQLNYSQIDPVGQKSEPSPAQQEPTDVGMLYAVPDKKKKTSNKAPGIPEKSSELFKYLDSKEVDTVSSGMDLSECSQTKSVVQSSRLRPSPAQQKPTDVEMLYAIPDKKKKAFK